MGILGDSNSGLTLGNVAHATYSAKNPNPIEQASVGFVTHKPFDLCPRALTPPVSTSHPSSSTGFGANSPNSNKKLHLEAKEHVGHALQQEVNVSNHIPKTLINARGATYLEGDPNMGYSEDDTKPRHPISPKHRLHQSLPTHSKPTQNLPKPKPKNWASLLQSQSPSMNMKLEFFPELLRGKQAQVEIDIKLTDVGKWNKYLMGHFLDGKMLYPLVVSTARYQWKELFVAVKPDVGGCYLFEFRDEQAKQQVLDGGPYFFSQKYLVLKDWHRMMKPVKEQPSHVPACIRLRNLPLELWNQECLSRVASTIGKPLHVDQATAKTSRQLGLLQTKSTSARICIEISVEHELPEDVRMTVEGESVMVPIEYQVLPLMCKQCQVFGHSTAQCSKKSSSTSSQPNQDGTIVSNGTHRNHPTQLNPCTTSSASPPSSKLVATPTVDDSKDESKKVLESIVSSSQETLILSQNEVPIPQLEEAVNTHKELDSLSQQKLLVTHVHNGTLQEEDGNNKVTTSFSEQNAAVSPILVGPVSRSVAKKATKIVAKLKDKAPPDSSGISDIKLMLGGSNKAGQFGRQKNSNLYGLLIYSFWILEPKGQQLWSNLQQLCVVTPWVVLGDFNAVKNPTEKVGVDRSWLPWVEEFNSCLRSTELVDLRYSGCHYTWSNKQLGDANISTKIDRVLVNESWNKEFCWSNAHFLNLGVFDHSPAVVYLTTASPPRKKPFSELSSRVASYKQQLEVIQRELGSNPSDPAKQAIERDLCKQYLVYARVEESLAKQKSRIQWLKLGDQCTSFFFKTISNSWNRNKISSLILEDGSVTSDIELVKHSFINYYTKLLGTKHLSDYSGSSRVNQLITKKLSHSQSLDMVLQPVIGHEVTSVVKLFFRSGQLLKKANATLVALVPKVPNPSKVGDYRPISCCNGRRIADNIFLTQELMRGHHKHSSSPRCAMKVDIMKAYDNVRWDFLWDVLISRNFLPKIIQWLKAGVSTTNYSLCFNGEAIGYIPRRKGLRQGDPLSSYLFVIVIEVLTCILKEKSRLPDFKFHWKCGSPKLVNLCFADDLMIFCKAYHQEIWIHIIQLANRLDQSHSKVTIQGVYRFILAGIYFNLFRVPILKCVPTISCVILVSCVLGPHPSRLQEEVINSRGFM
ncbi:uncharacterized protein LOC131306776 [Rhododendron vialii]|uniref:uncharacterized protein LOC131306776 n=1 Tax=Rhododendron vialii TaxID=182163 RepID=UPI00265F4399|nr:uncharacterized protein LOC131306776 [Rhododendron vialii]